MVLSVFQLLMTLGQLGQPLHVLPHKAQRLKFELVLLVELAVPLDDLGLTLLLKFVDQKLFRQDGQNPRLYQFHESPPLSIQYVWGTLPLAVYDGSNMVLSVF